MHFFTSFSPLAAALLMATSTVLATPVAVQDQPAAPVPSAHAAPPAEDREPVVILAVAVPEAEVAVLNANLTSTDLDESTAAFSEGDSSSEAGGLTKRSYMASCDSCSIVSGNALQCRCRTAGGSWIWSALNLNYCIANYGGYLAWAPNGGFGGSCTGYWFAYYHIFGSWCYPYPGGSTIYSQLDLDTNIHNYNGYLGCAI